MAVLSTQNYRYIISNKLTMGKMHSYEVGTIQIHKDEIERISITYLRHLNILGKITMG